MCLTLLASVVEVSHVRGHSKHQKEQESHCLLNETVATGKEDTSIKEGALRSITTKSSLLLCIHSKLATDVGNPKPADGHTAIML